VLTHGEIEIRKKMALKSAEIHQKQPENGSVERRKKRVLGTSRKYSGRRHMRCFSTTSTPPTSFKGAFVNHVTRQESVRVRAGVYGCVRVCADVCGCVRVCADVYGCVRVCAGVCG